MERRKEAKERKRKREMERESGREPTPQRQLNSICRVSDMKHIRTPCCIQGTWPFTRMMRIWAAHHAHCSILLGVLLQGFSTISGLDDSCRKSIHIHMQYICIYIYSIDLEPCLPSESISQTPAWFLWCNLPCPDDMQNGHGYQTGLHRKWTANCLPPSKTPPVRSLYNFGWS